MLLNGAAQPEETALPFPQFALLHSVQLEYLVATVQGQLRSGRAGPFVKVEGCCD
jgi:hypothetical protein